MKKLARKSSKLGVNAVPLFTILVLTAVSLELWMSFSLRMMSSEEFLLDIPISNDVQSFRPPPRVVSIDSENPARLSTFEFGTRSRTMESTKKDCRYCKLEADFYVWDFERPFYEKCTPMKPWQTTFFPTCNILHEIALADVRSGNEALLSMKGNWRSVWGIRDGTTLAVLKMLKFQTRDFTHESFQHNVIDSLAMERLQSSPYIIDEYGFCGQSVLTEFARGNARMHLKKELDSVQRLEMGKELARAFEALHSIDYPNSTKPTFAHNDINIANVVEVNGRIKLNDFNIGVLMRWNGTRPCGYPPRFKAKLWKSPEDIRNTSYIDPAAADVYGLGNLLFQVLTTRQPWTHLEPEGPLKEDLVSSRKLEGKMPYFPQEFSNSSDIAIQALFYAAQACYRYNPEQRLSSHELAEALEQVLGWARKGVIATRPEIKQLFQKK